MARAARSTQTKGVDGSTNRRRSARYETLGVSEIVSAEEVGDKSEETKSSGKRGLECTASLPAAELRRSKRVKSDGVLKPDETVKAEKKEKKKKKKESVKKEDDVSPPLLSLPPVKIKVKAETDDDDGDDKRAATPTLSRTKAAADLQAKKLKSYAQFAEARQSPYPDFARPLPAECKLAHGILARLHGAQTQPPSDAAVVAPAARAGCGESASVLDALVRTILSQNTSDANSTRAKLSMDAAYGGSSDAWDAIAAGGAARLAAAIESGGLARIKAGVILDILAQTRARHGAYSLDHLFSASSDAAMRELLGFRGVGPKTASCVLLFCLRRPSFAVDTHVHRITGLLGWRPAGATRDQTHAHLDARVPDEDKYGLHVLLVRHGRACAECRAGGKSLGRCELRRAFRGGRVRGEVEGEVKEEEEEKVEGEDVGGDDGDGNAKG
ncbi:hypothetical protein ANO14919_116970 [Xylariales sp. No.14919]|nr:hypothetical protein ANO14919_116970 [Xylariales sp. No.14919]